MRKKFVAVVFDVIIVADDAISDIQTQTHTYIHKHDRANFKKERKKKEPNRKKCFFDSIKFEEYVLMLNRFSLSINDGAIQ